MRVTESEAKAILQEAHLAWCEGDVDGTLDYYCDDLTYICNTGGLDGAPLLNDETFSHKDDPPVDQRDSDHIRDHIGNPGNGHLNQPPSSRR